MRGGALYMNNLERKDNQREEMYSKYAVNPAKIAHTTAKKYPIVVPRVII